MATIKISELDADSTLTVDHKIPAAKNGVTVALSGSVFATSTQGGKADTALQPADLTAHVNAPDPHPQYLTPTEGSAAFDASGLAASTVAAHVASFDPHAVYANDAEMLALAVMLNVKANVKCATTANITLSGLQTIDGYTTLAGDRVLVKNQTAGAQNGIYVAASGAWSRATDFDSWAEMQNAVVLALNGTTNQYKAWRFTAGTHGVVDTTAATFAAFFGSGNGKLLYVNVESFGVQPGSGVDYTAGASTEIFTALRYGCLPGVCIYWPGGDVIASINLDNSYSGLKCHFGGTAFAGIWHMISSGSVTTFAITAITRTANVAVATVASTSGLPARGRVLYTAGGTSTFDADDVAFTIVDPTHFSYASVGANESATANNGIAVENALKNTSFTGRFSTYDRLGSINWIKSYVQDCTLKNDSTKNYSGVEGRGAHFTTLSGDIQIDNFTVEGCGNASNTDAAISIDGNGAWPYNFKFGRVRVYDSKVHGVYVCGPGHDFDELQIDGYGSASYGGSGLQDSSSLAQSQRLCGVMFNRVFDVRVRRLIINQPVGSRPNATYHLLVVETGNTTLAAGNMAKPLIIDTLLARNLQAKSIAIGDQDEAARANLIVEIGRLSAHMEATTTLTREMLSIAAPSARSRVVLGSAVFLNLNGSNTAIKVYSGARFYHGCIEAPDFHGTILRAFGLSIGGPIIGVWSGGSLGDYVVEYNGAGAKGSVLNGAIITCTSGLGTGLLRILTADNVRIRDVVSALFRGSSVGQSVLVQDSNGCSIVGLETTSSAGVGVGVFMRNLTDFLIANVRPTGFATGFSKYSGAALTRCTSLNNYSTGNTAATDVPAATFADLGSTGFQLGNRSVTNLNTVTYSASMTIDAATGNSFTITATDGTAFTINAPTNPATGEKITVTLRNASGGALGAATWNAVFKMAAWTNPANANSRSIEFRYDGTNWVEVSRTPADVPN
jgi:hypothetical protein